MNEITMNALLVGKDMEVPATVKRLISDRRLLNRYTLVDGISDAVSLLESESYDVIISDFQLSDGTIFDIIDQAKDSPIVCLLDQLDEQIASKVIMAGALDCLIKDPEQNYLKLLPVILEKVKKHLNSKSIRQQIESALVESENKYRILFEKSRDAIYISTREGKFIDFNQSMIELLGYTREELKNINVINIYQSPLARAKFQKEIEKNKTVLDYKVKLRKKDGTVLDCLLTTSILYSEQGEVLGYHGSIHDVTEHIQSERLLHKSEERYRDIFENANDLIQSIGADGSFLNVNKKWHQLLGYNEEELKTMTYTDILRKDMIPHCEEIFRLLATGKDFENIETVFIDKSGKEIYMEGNINAQFLNGKFIATRGIFRDITERKKAEEQMRTLQEELKKANMMLSLGYAAERTRKDEIQTLIYQEEIGFIINGHGNILSLTDKALTFTGRNRLDILDSDISSLIDEETRTSFINEIQHALIGGSSQTTVAIQKPDSKAKTYDVNIMRLNIKMGKNLLVLIRESKSTEETYET